MNKKLSSLLFTKYFSKGNASFSGSTLFGMNTIKAIALSATLAMGGCATTETMYNDYESHNAFLSNTGQQTRELKTFNKDTYKDIFEHERSGVYADPYGGKSIVTVQFLFDKNAEASIKKDLANIGINPNKFTYRDRTKDLPPGAMEGNINLSFHTQPEYNTKDEVNLTILENNDVRTGFFAPAVFEENHDFKYYDEYFIAMHEFAHGFKYQRLGFINTMSAVFNGDGLTTSQENGADFAALAMTMKLMIEDGKSPQEIRKFTDLSIHHRSLNGYNPNDVEPHFTSPSLSVLSNIYNSNPKAIYDMTGQDIMNASEVVSSMVLDHDFSNDIIYAFTHNDTELRDSLKQSVKNLIPADMNVRKFESNLEREIENTDERSIQGRLYQHVKALKDSVVIMSDKGIDNLIDKSFYQYVDSMHGVYMDRHDAQKLFYDLGVVDFPEINQSCIDALQEQNLVTKYGFEKFSLNM